MSPVDQLIQAAYRSLFGREPDPPGLEVYRTFLGEDPAARLGDMLDVLLTSAEARSRMVDPLTLVQVHADRRTVGPGDVARIVSLGSRCSTSQSLQDFGLRDRSMPFDWIFSTPEMVVHCLEDDFALFLQPEQYQPIPVWRRRIREFNLCDHVTFRDTYGIQAMFNHRDPTLIDDYLYLNRCVERFRDVMHSTEPTLFVLVADSHPSHEDAYIRLFYALESACAGPVALLFVVVNSRASDGPLPFVRSVRCDGQHELVLFDAVGELGGTRFERVADTLALEALVRRYRFSPVLLDGVEDRRERREHFALNWR